MAGTNTPQELLSVFRIIDESQEAIVASIKELVAIPSVSAQKEHRTDLDRCVEWSKKLLEGEGVCVDLEPLDSHRYPDGSHLPAPSLLLGCAGDDKEKKTVLAYAYLDVHPAEKSDGWHTNPFVPTEKDGKLFGRGSAAGKGHVVAWIWALRAFNRAGVKLPVNIKFVFDPMKEVGSEGFLEYLKSERASDFFDDIHTVVISSGCWLSRNKPCLSYGLRGLCYFQIQVTCATSDLHSGVYGGTLIEAMPDVTHLLNSLVDDDGCITIPDFNDDVDDLRAEEARMYENNDFSRNAYREELGVGVLPHEDKKETLMHRWRCPSLSIHGIHGDYCGPGEKAVIPGRVTGKFSVRTVPYQKSQKVCECVTRHVEREFARRNSPNKLKITASTCSEPWIVDPRSAHFRSAASAVKHVYGTKPDLIRSGGTVAAAAALRDHVTANVIQMPISASDGYSENEYIPIEDLVRGAKLFAAYCYEIAKMP